MIKYFKGVVSELKQVTWLTPRVTFKLTILIVLFLIIASLSVWGIDVGLTAALSKLIGGVH